MGKAIALVDEQDGIGDLDFANIRDMLVRVEAIPTDGWMLYGRPVTEWAEKAVRETEVVESLARRIARSEGLDPESGEWARRLTEIEDEARRATSRGSIMPVGDLRQLRDIEQPEDAHRPVEID